MASITLNSVEYDYIIDTEILTGENLATLPEFINQSPSIDTNVWNKNVERVSYTMRVTDAQKWVLDQLLVGHTVVALVDTTYGYTNNVWCSSIEAIYNRKQNDTYRWEITVELIIVL
jgi:hypothetical protein